MEGDGNPAVIGGELASSAPARVASHDPGSGSGRAAYGESLADMKKRRKEYVIFDVSNGDVDSIMMLSSLPIV